MSTVIGEKFEFFCDTVDTKLVIFCQKIFGSTRFKPGTSPKYTVFTTVASLTGTAVLLTGKGPQTCFGDTKVSKFEFEFAVRAEFEIEFTVRLRMDFNFTVGLQIADPGLGSLR